MQSEEEYEQETPVDPDRLMLDELKLPSGKGWVRFKDPNMLRGTDVAKIREAGGSTQNQPMAGQAVMHKAIGVLVDDWEVEYLADDVRSPRYDLKSITKLFAGDMVALERHILPVLRFFNPESKRDGGDGNP